MKRLATGLTLLALVFSLVVGLPVAAQGGGVNISIQPPEVTVPEGKCFTVDIQIDAGVQPVAGVDAFLNFDPAFLQVIKIVPGDVFNIVLMNRFDNEAGTINYGAGTFGPAPSGTFTLATITFNAVAETPGTSLSFSTEFPRKTDAAFRGEIVTGVITGGMVTIGEAENQPPVVNAGPDQTVNEGDMVSFSGNFTEPDCFDTHTYSWDFGDGTPAVAGTLNPTHVYLKPGSYIVTLTVTDNHGGVGSDTLTVTVKGIPVVVVIDIKPGSYPNSINPKSKGVIPVAILTTSKEVGEFVDFDATMVDAETVRFGPAEAQAIHYALEDVDNDGDIDIVLHFKTQEGGIAEGDTSATLLGQTLDGRHFEGTDSVRTVGK